MRSLFVRSIYKETNGERGRAHGSDDTRFQGRYTYKVDTGKQDIIVNRKHVNNNEECWDLRDLIGVSAKMRRTRVVETRAKSG